MSKTLVIREIGRQSYEKILSQMKHFTNVRSESTADEIWILEHHPVFTQGQAGNSDYILASGDIPVVQSDRGGHVTFHGHGQITAYTLIDLKRANSKIFGLIDIIENSVIETMALWNVEGHTEKASRGVFCESGNKIASIGLRVRKGHTYHGVNFNIDMDMSPWSRINACGLGLEMTQLKSETYIDVQLNEVQTSFREILTKNLGYNNHTDKIILTEIEHKDDDSFR